MHFLNKPNIERDSFVLDNFEGPLDFLLLLIQKDEIDICQIFLGHIIHQYTNHEELPDLDRGAEFIGTFSNLLWLKSKTLLPLHELQEEDEGLVVPEQDPQFEIIHHLVDYCRFKDAAKILSEQEERQNGIYARGIDSIPEVKKKLGIEHLSLDDFAQLFQQLMTKAACHTGTVHEEPWKVSDKIRFLRDMLENDAIVPFEILFSYSRSRIELIVTFLAILELIKLGEINVIRETQTGKIGFKVGK